jgi:hypothetical protein
MMKLHVENERNKPENLGLKARLNPGFGFVKSSGYPGFRVPFGKTRVANPSRCIQYVKIYG